MILLRSKSFCTHVSTPANHIRYKNRLHCDCIPPPSFSKFSADQNADTSKKNKSDAQRAASDSIFFQNFKARPTAPYSQPSFSICAIILLRSLGCVRKNRLKCPHALLVSL